MYHLLLLTKSTNNRCAPEVLRSRRFSSKSDVYAYGVLLVEIFNNGNRKHRFSAQTFSLNFFCCCLKVPWGWLGNKDVFDKVLDGEKHPKPHYCPQEIYEVMLDCWKEEADQRPSFKDVLQRMKEIGKKLFPADPAAAPPTKTEEGHYIHPSNLEYM
jgi:serine/threonine protein kinase